jgi:Zn-dependent protease
MIIQLIGQFRANGAKPVEIFIGLLACVIAVFFSLCTHEWAHAFAAYKSGDPTAKHLGRLTINPFRHIDPIGAALLLFAGFGWAKPVPVNALNFEHPRKGMFFTSIAGIVSNLIMAFLSVGILSLVKLIDVAAASNYVAYVYYLLFYFFLFMVSINIVLFLFNLLPVFPLDGFRIVETFTRPGNRFLRFMQKNGFLILLSLLLLGVMFQEVDILGYYLNYGSAVILWPIEKFWGLFL